MWAKTGLTFISLVVFPAETPGANSAIYLDNSDLRRLLHYRLETLEAALLKLSELAREQPQHRKVEA